MKVESKFNSIKSVLYQKKKILEKKFEIKINQLNHSARFFLKSYWYHIFMAKAETHVIDST